MTFQMPEGLRESTLETIRILDAEDAYRKAHVRQHWWQFWRESELAYIARKMGW